MKKKFFGKNLPNWVRNIFYALMLLETIIVVIIFHAPEMFIQIVERFI